MNEITFEVERDESGWLIASWDAPDGKGGIATQGQDLRELQENVKEAVGCHFEAAAAPTSKSASATNITLFIEYSSLRIQQGRERSVPGALICIFWLRGYQ